MENKRSEKMEGNIFLTLTLLGIFVGFIGLFVYWLIFAGCYVLLMLGDFIEGK